MSLITCVNTDKSVEVYGVGTEICEGKNARVSEQLLSLIKKGSVGASLTCFHFLF